MSPHRSHRKEVTPPPPPPQPAERRIWETFVVVNRAETPTGFLVATVNAAGRPDQLVAHVFDDDDAPGTRRRAIDKAKALVEDPSLMDREPGMWFDLRFCGRWQASVPVPAWLYAAEFRPLVEDAEDKEARRPCHINPPCPFRCAEMTKELARQARDTKGEVRHG